MKYTIRQTLPQEWAAKLKLLTLLQGEFLIDISMLEYAL